MMNISEKMVIVSGIQPSGNLHLGNYFGAVQQFIQFIEGGHECYYFLANYHALTSLREPQRLLDTRYLELGQERAPVSQSLAVIAELEQNLD